jgi:hypothetical protein
MRPPSYRPRQVARPKLLKEVDSHGGRELCVGRLRHTAHRLVRFVGRMVDGRVGVEQICQIPWVGNVGGLFRTRRDPFYDLVESQERSKIRVSAYREGSGVKRAFV